EAGGAIVIRLGGELDLFNAPVVRKALAEAASRGPERLVGDLAEGSFIDSTALRVLIEARTELPNRRALLLAPPRLPTPRAPQASGRDRHLGVHDTGDVALAAPL